MQKLICLLLFHYACADPLQYDYVCHKCLVPCNSQLEIMEFVRLTYEVMSKPGRKEHYIAFTPGQVSPRDLAAALMQHEFPTVEFPFGPDGNVQAEEVLKRYGIVNVTHSLIRRDMEPAREGRAQAR